MKHLFLWLVAGSSLVLASGCQSEDFDKFQPVSKDLTPHSSELSSENSAGATRIAGVGYYAEETDCKSEGAGADFALKLTGDLNGCLFVYVESYGCSPSGTYRETGSEYFVGTYNGSPGTFWTNYRFEAKYEGCTDDGFFAGAEIFGRCQHPLVEDSGTGVFEGMTGRLDFKDEVETGAFPYRGHLK